ncbi:MAG: UvrB/UvrC motif-containing protein [Planctomycetota bacterium]|jgi:protein arginine kinase activator
MAAPFRTCDHCSKPAVVHNTVIVNGKVTEVHLCEEHAAAAGIQLPGHAPIHALLGQLAQVGAARPRGPACPECGHTFNDFKSTGLLGCAACYRAFASTVAPVIARSHGGATEHVGRRPARAEVAAERTALLTQLGRELEEAVAAEQYERAARLRDRIRELRPAGAPGQEGTA